MQLCGDSDIISFVRISRLIWIGHDNRTDSNRKERQVFNNNPQRSLITGRPKTNGVTEYKQKLIDVKLKNRKERSKKSAHWEKSIRGRSSASECSAF